MVLFLRRGVLIVFCVGLLAACTMFSFFSAERAVSVSSQVVLPEAEPIFVLDAGHGGADGGALSVDGVAEADINLAVTLRLRDVLALLGHNAVLTRSDERSLADDPSDTLRRQKISDTQNRAAMTNSIENARLLSIHQNTLPGHGSVHGAQVFYNAVDGSEQMAQTVQGSLNEVINRDNKKQIKPISETIYLMQAARCPAILVECGFLSHAEESKLLQTNEYQTLLALTIGCAAVQCG